LIILANLKLSDANLRWKYDSSSTIKKYFTSSSPINFQHHENVFNDFSVQSLLPGYLSRQGPCLAKSDINNDGLEDIFVGSAKRQPSQIFILVLAGNNAWTRIKFGRYKANHGALLLGNGKGNFVYVPYKHIIWRQ